LERSPLSKLHADQYLGVRDLGCNRFEIQTPTGDSSPNDAFGYSVCGWPGWLFPHSIYHRADYGGDPTIFAPWVPMLILGVFLVLTKWFLTRTWDRYFVVGFRRDNSGLCTPVLGRKHRMVVPRRGLGNRLIPLKHDFF